MKVSNQPKETYLNAANAAKHIGRSYKWLWEQRKKGLIDVKYDKTSKRAVYAVSELERLVLPISSYEVTRLIMNQK